MLNRRGIILFCVVGATVATLCTWPGCSNPAAPTANPTTAAPPTVHAPRLADPTANSPLVSDPLAGGPWSTAKWSSLLTPLNATRTVPPTRTATLYDETKLYVAFACTAEAALATPDARLPAPDTVEVWLDTTPTQAGTELVCLSVTPEGKANGTWYRPAQPPRPKDDGTPDLDQPISRFAAPVTGLEVQTGKTTLEGKPAWTVVVSIPLAGLPTPLKLDPQAVKEGLRWKINCIRSTYVPTAGGKELLQGHLSPVFTSCQQLSPYRMAQLVLDGPASVAKGPRE